MWILIHMSLLSILRFAIQRIWDDFNCLILVLKIVYGQTWFIFLFCNFGHQIFFVEWSLEPAKWGPVVEKLVLYWDEVLIGDIFEKSWGFIGKLFGGAGVFAVGFSSCAPLGVQSFGAIISARMFLSIHSTRILWISLGPLQDISGNTVFFYWVFLLIFGWDDFFVIFVLKSQNLVLVLHKLLLHDTDLRHFCSPLAVLFNFLLTFLVLL